MGGAVSVQGNVGSSGAGIANEFAEWNIYIDPHAAGIVFDSGVPITLVPLDATQHAPVTMGFYQRLESLHSGAEATFVYDLLTANLGFVESGGAQFWDSLTATIATDESLATFETYELQVVEEEGVESGRTRPSPGGASVRVAVSANGPRFEDTFLSVLNSP
jgi:inosine-uridine nucleoside N-ribohydrolase